MTKFQTVAAALLAATLGSAAAAQDIQYTLTNDSSVWVMEFYTSPTSAESWGDDLLAEQDLEPGYETIVTIADGEAACDYDLLFILEDGTEVSDQVNICELATYTLHD